MKLNQETFDFSFKLFVNWALCIFIIHNVVLLCCGHVTSCWCLLMRSWMNFGLTLTLAAIASLFTSLWRRKTLRYFDIIHKNQKVQHIQNHEWMNSVSVRAQPGVLSPSWRRANGKRFVSLRMKSKATLSQVIRAQRALHFYLLTQPLSCKEHSLSSEECKKRILQLKLSELVVVGAVEGHSLTIHFSSSLDILQAARNVFGHSKNKVGHGIFVFRNLAQHLFGSLHEQASVSHRAL